MDKVLSKEDILESKNLHNYYFPNGDSGKPMIHDRDCHFCDYENQVEAAMDEFANQEKRIEAIAFCQDVLNNIEVNGLKLIDYMRVDAEQLYELFQKSK